MKEFRQNMDVSQKDKMKTAEKHRIQEYRRNLDEESKKKEKQEQKHRMKIFAKIWIKAKKKR